MNRKGMSQTLALIVAASVLMMTALTVIFMVQGGLTDTDEGLSSSACYNAISAQCSGSTTSLDRVPSTCYSDGNPVDDRLPSNRLDGISDCSKYS